MSRPGEPARLDSLVEVTPGESKRLGDCTASDLRAASFLAEQAAEHYAAAVKALSEGRAPGCDCRNPDGTYCERPADYFRMVPVDGGPSWPEAKCADHAVIEDESQ